MVIACCDLDLRLVRFRGALLLGRVRHDEAHVSIFKIEDQLLLALLVSWYSVLFIGNSLHLSRLTLWSKDQHAWLGLLLSYCRSGVVFKCVVLGTVVTGLFRPTRGHHLLELLRRLEEGVGCTFVIIPTQQLDWWTSV